MQERNVLKELCCCGSPEVGKAVKRNIVLRSLGLTLEVHQYKKMQRLSEAVVVASRFYWVTLNIYSSYCDLASDLGFPGPPASGHGICPASFFPPSWQDEQSSPITEMIGV